MVKDGGPGNIAAEKNGPTPKPLALKALAGRTGIEVIIILRKGKIEMTDFDIRVISKINSQVPLE